MTRTYTIAICVGVLVWLQETEATPLDALRSIWVIEDSSWTANPAHLAQWRQTHTEVEVGRHAVAHSAAGEGETRTMTGSHRLRLSRGTLEIDGQSMGTDLSLRARGNLLSSLPHHSERLMVTYGAMVGRHLDLGAMVATSAGLQGGAIGARLDVRQLLVDAYYYGSSAGRSSRVDLDEEELLLESSGLYSEAGLTLRGQVTPRLNLTIRGAQSTLDPGDRRDGHALDAAGHLRSFNGSWKARISRRFAVVGEVRHRVLQGNPDGHLEGRQFLRGHLDLSDVGGALWLRRMGAGRDHVDFGFFLSHGDASLSRGRLESWAFINGFASLLGGKDWSGSGQADLRVVGAGVRLQKQSRAWSLGTDTRLLRATSGFSGVVRERTKLDFSSLFFPTTYRQQGEIVADTMDMRASIGYQPARWGVRYELAQIIPLRVRSTFEVDGSSGEGSSGTQHRLVLVIQ
jgi:hypothetical protein